MTVYNVKVSVVELVTADSPEEAIRIFEDRLEASGYDVYESDFDPSTAFESEDQS